MGIADEHGREYTTIASLKALADIVRKNATATEAVGEWTVNAILGSRNSEFVQPGPALVMVWDRAEDQVRVLYRMPRGGWRVDQATGQFLIPEDFYVTSEVLNQLEAVREAWNRMPRSGWRPWMALVVNYGIDSSLDPFPHDNAFIDRVLRGRGDLSAAPGDEAGLIQELVDQVVVYANEAFRRADIIIEGIPLPARSEGRHSNGSPQYNRDLMEQSGEWFRQGVYLLRYAWVFRQFMRGALELGLMAWHERSHFSPPGPPHDDLQYSVEEWLSTDVAEADSDEPEAVLGRTMWMLGWNVRKEVQRVSRDQTSTLRSIIEGVRSRLRWPRLPEDYDPPVPGPRVD